MGNSFQMELYNPTTDVLDTAAFEQQLYEGDNFEAADLDTTELYRGSPTCRKTAKALKKWVRAVMRHPKYRRASLKAKGRMMKKVVRWAMKFDRRNRCGWVKAWKSRCRKMHNRLRKFVKKVYRMKAYTRASMKGRRLYWRKVAKKVLKGARLHKCGMVSRRWRKTVKAAKIMRKRGYGYMLLRK